MCIMLSSNKRKIYLSNGKHAEIEYIDEKEFNEVLSKNVKQVEETIFERYNSKVLFYDDKFYVNENGDSYFVIESDSMLKELYYDFADRDYGFDSLYGRNQYGKDLLEKKDSIIETFLSETFLKNDINVVRSLNEKVNKEENYKEFIDDNLLEIILLIGEQVSHKVNGQLKIKLSDDKITWIPYIEVNNEDYFYYMYLIEELNESDKTKDYILDFYLDCEAVLTYRNVKRLDVNDL